MKLEEGKKLHNVFKSNLNEISRETFKSDEQKMTLKNTKLLYKSRDAVIKLFNDYSSIVSEGKYKTIHEKRIPSMLASFELAICESRFVDRIYLFADRFEHFL